MENFSSSNQLTNRIFSLTTTTGSNNNHLTTNSINNEANNLLQSPEQISISTPLTRTRTYLHDHHADDQTLITPMKLYKDFTTAEPPPALSFDYLKQEAQIVTSSLSDIMTRDHNLSILYQPQNSSQNLATNNFRTLLLSPVTTTATAGPEFLLSSLTTFTLELTNTSNNNNKIMNQTSMISDSQNYDYFSNLTWSKGCAVAIFLFLIFITVIGNTLVILSVLTTRRLRTVTNCFVMNLAITDWLVGIFVMPPAVILYIVGSWKFGWILCDIWISLDVLLCTASILSLCAISLDRYLAVIQPLTYSKKRRSKRLAMFMIFIVWIVAFSITCPPFLGWYEPGRTQSPMVECRYNHNKGYVVFSAMGSFFIPMTVMLYVYLNIGFVLTSRRQRINLTEASEKSPENDADCENFLTETEHIIHQCSPKMFQKYYNKSKPFHNDLLLSSHQHLNSVNILQEPLNNTTATTAVKRNPKGIEATTLYELIEISRSSMIRCSTISCKYSTTTTTTTTTNLNDKNINNNSTNSSNINQGNGGACNDHIPMESIHYSRQSHSSFAESNLSAAKYKAGHHQPHQPNNPHNNMQQQHIFNSGTGTTNATTKSQRIPPMRISTQKRDTKTAKTLTMVMGGFIVCWLPFFTYYILIPFLPPDGVNESLMSFLTWVGWVNCAINPFIYAFYNPDFRTAFWRLTFRRICKKPTNHLKIFKS